MATGHSILVIAYHILGDECDYNELGADFFEKLNASYLEKQLIKRLSSLGLKVTVEPMTAAA